MFRGFFRVLKTYARTIHSGHQLLYLCFAPLRLGFQSVYFGMSFAGFSEADWTSPPSRPVKKGSSSTSRRVVGKLPVMMKKKPPNLDPQEPPPPPIPEAARLASPAPKTPAEADNPVNNSSSSNPDLLNHVQDPPRPREEETGPELTGPKEDPPQGGGPKTGEASVKEEEENDTRSKIEIMQARQKQMEEENLKKKRILAQAIAERKERTSQETEKLQRAQLELGQIDKCLSADVRLIRDEIETASIDFLESQKRYDRAEKEFVNAKLRLHQTSERKEQLTEHLITVIQQSELRKGQKLEEIMRVLDIESA